MTHYAQGRNGNKTRKGWRAVERDPMRTQTDDRYLTAEEVADYLKLPLVTVYLYARNGSLPAAKLGKHWRFSLNLLNEWINRTSGMSEQRPTLAVLITSDQRVRTSISRWLREAQCRVETVAGVQEGLRFMSRERVNLVLLDLRAKGFDGIDTLRRIRDRAAQADVAIMGRDFDRALMDQALEIGPFTVLRKPVRKQHLMSLLQ
jgi:excisionase family DNA binding protein